MFLLLKSIKIFFSTSEFMPHIYCYNYKSSLIWTMAITDVLNGLAYLFISLSLYFFYKKIHLPFLFIFLTFECFLFFGGMTHFMDVYALCRPSFWLVAFFKTMTLMTAIIAAINLIKMTPKIILFVNAAKDSEQKRIDLNNHANELQKTIEKLYETQDRFRLLVESVKDYAIFMLDTEGRIKTWNEGAKHLKQYEADEIIGKSFSIFYEPEDLKLNKPANELIAAQALGRYEDEGWRLRKDGSRFWANVIITPIKDKHDKLIGFSKVTRDLTERKNAEEALKLANAQLQQRFIETTEELRESESMFLKFADSMPQLAWIAKPDGFRVWYNKGWYEYTGTTPEIIEGWGWQSVHDPKTLPTVMAEWKKSIASQKPMEMTYQIKGADGKFKWFLTRVTPIFNSKGELTRWFGTNTNVDERILELEIANKELEAFSYSVSHDLRAPLRSIDGFSKILLTEYYEKFDIKGRDYLNRVRLAAQKMGILIDALLSLSRVSRTKMKIEMVDLSFEVKRILDDFKLLEPTRNVNVIISDGIIAKGDPELIRILLQNLLSNAWKFTSKKESATIEFGVRQEIDRAVYFVRDTGVGFDMAYIDKLFGAFQRLHSDLEFEGTGIGLVTVSRIVRRHGGEVWAEATPNVGATFFFTLKLEGNK